MNSSQSQIKDFFAKAIYNKKDEEMDMLPDCSSDVSGLRVLEDWFLFVMVRCIVLNVPNAPSFCKIILVVLHREKMRFQKFVINNKLLKSLSEISLLIKNG